MMKYLFLSIVCLLPTIAWSAPKPAASATGLICQSGDSLMVRPRCRAGETRMSFSQLQVAGPQGPQGPQGPKGDAGVSGPSGEAGKGFVLSCQTFSTVTYSGVDSSTTLGIVECPSGTYLLNWAYTSVQTRLLVLRDVLMNYDSAGFPYRVGILVQGDIGSPSAYTDNYDLRVNATCCRRS